MMSDVLLSTIAAMDHYYQDPKYGTLYVGENGTPLLTLRTTMAEVAAALDKAEEAWLAQCGRVPLTVLEMAACTLRNLAALGETPASVGGVSLNIMQHSGWWSVEMEKDYPCELPSGKGAVLYDTARYASAAEAFQAALAELGVHDADRAREGGAHHTKGEHMVSEDVHGAELSDDEQRLLTQVYASLKECILDEIEYHLEDTFPEMPIERERQFALRAYVAHTLDTLAETMSEALEC